jgi:hypothetical protein
VKQGKRQGRAAWGASSTLLRAPRYIERSLTVAALLAVIGLILVGAGIYLGGVGGTVISSMGTICVTVALLSVLYDAYLKDVLLSEIYDALAIEQNIRAIDLREIVQKGQLELATLLADAQSVTAIPLDPETWSRTDWQQVVDYAGRRAVKVTVLLPDHDSPHIDVLAQRLGVDRDGLIQQIRRLPDELARSWDEKAAANDNSTFRVFLYSGVPAVGILATDRITMIEIPPTLTHAAIDRSTLTVVLGRNGTSTLVTDFVDEQLQPHRIPDFSQSVMRPLEQTVSPDPPSLSPES